MDRRFARLRWLSSLASAVWLVLPLAAFGISVVLGLIAWLLALPIAGLFMTDVEYRAARTNLAQGSVRVTATLGVVSLAYYLVTFIGWGLYRRGSELE